MKKAILLLTFLMSLLPSMAQVTVVKGQVIAGDDDSPIIGAAVTVTGTNQGANTDLEGNFVIKGIKPGAKTLTVSYVGMQTAVVDIAPEVKVILQPAAQMMEDVVVVAFGKQKREAFTGSAGVVKADELLKVQTNDAISALEGKVSGVQISNDNDPSGEPTVTIRGIGTINASSSPLIVVDGMPYNGYFRDINPADIDNISVLKDAASNALYGARGANGVILITTKNAQKGNTKVTFDMKWGVNTDAKVDYNVITEPGEYYEAHYAALRNYYVNKEGLNASDAHVKANQTLSAPSGSGGLGYMVYTVPQNQMLIGTNGKLNPNATLGNIVNYNGKDYYLTPDNWRENGLRDGFRQEYNFNISGGTDRSTFYASLGYLDTEGIAYGSELKRFSAKIKADYDAYSWLKVGANTSYTNTESDAQADAFSVCHDIAPIYPLFIRDGNGNIMTDAHGPMYDYGDEGNAGLVRTVEKSSNSIQNDLLNTNLLKSNAFNLQGYATFNMPWDMSFTVNGTVYVLETRLNYAVNPYYGYMAQSGGYLWTQHWRRIDKNSQQLLNWHPRFGEHSLDILLGHEYTKQSEGDLEASKYNVGIFDQNIELDGAIINGDITGNCTDYNVEGWFGRAQYDYASRYFASASYRRDGSSRFMKGHRWGNFWSLGGAWIISKEAWFPKTPAVNMLKYKISYGSQGNDNIADYLYADFYTIENSNNEVALLFKRKGNPNITWETVGNLNTGFEFEFFNSRISGSVEYYHRKTTDMLTTTQIPSTMGYTYYWDNVGDMVNQGFELNLSATPVRTRDLSWTLNGNFSWNHNRITRLSDDNRQMNLDGHAGYQSGWFFYGEDLPLYTWYMPRYAGPGSDGLSRWVTTEKYADKDASGQPVTNAQGEYLTSLYSLAQYYDCGTALPDLFGGFGTTFKAYGVDLSLQFTFSVGGKKLDYGYQSLMSAPLSGYTGLNIHRDVLAAWTPENTDSDIPRWQYEDTYANATSDRFLVDASSLTFRSINLGYTLPKKWTNAFKANSMRLFFTVDNVAYWTKRKGFDPRNVLTTGDDTLYSPMRTFMGGFNVVF